MVRPYSLSVVRHILVPARGRLRQSCLSLSCQSQRADVLLECARGFSKILPQASLKLKVAGGTSGLGRDSRDTGAPTMIRRLRIRSRPENGRVRVCRSMSLSTVGRSTIYAACSVAVRMVDRLGLQSIRLLTRLMISHRSKPSARSRAWRNVSYGP